jgi:hypothetical protein
MAKSQKVSQKKWLKGVNAASTTFAQPPGSHPRSSNLVLTKRGGLVTCDGTSLLSVLNDIGTIGPHIAREGWGPMTELFLFQPTGSAASYYGIIKSVQSGGISPIGPPTVADGGAGGVLNGSYEWAITALDGAGGESNPSPTVIAVVPAGHKANVSWTALPLAVSYNVYRTAVGNTFPLEKLNATPIIGTSYLDNITDGARIPTGPPLSNTTQITQFWNLVLPVYSFANKIIDLPADLPVIQGGGGVGGFGGGGIGGSGGGTSTGQQPPQPTGGILGNISPIPQILQFNNKMILALGNGFPPYQSDGTLGGTIPLTNSFTASYPARANSTAQVAGDLMTLGGVLYKATQSGTTAAGAPAFNTALGQSTADGTVIWVSQGPVNAVPAPRGAAHAIVYAGSLWVFNTSPNNTTDNFDGPSCLKMSDLNNPNSWNPLNVAFLDKDDGSQGMGLATYTIAESGIPPTGSLVAFKEFSTFQINGVFGASNFSIQRAQTDLGCVAPRTIQFVPGFGIVRMTHLGIAMFDGVRDRLLSEEIRPYIFGGLSDIQAVDWNFIWNSKAALVSSPPMYACAVPIIPSTKTLPLTVTSIINFNVGVSQTTIPLGTYYAILYMQDAQGLYYKSQEFGPIVIGSGDCFQINLTQPANGVNYFFAYGNTPGGENLLVPINSINLSNSNLVLNPGFPATVPFTSAGMLNRLLCYDLVLKGWIIIDLPFAIGAMKTVRTPGSIPITVMGGFSDMAMRRWQAGDVNWDSGAITAGSTDQIVRWSVRSPEVFGKDASDRVYFRQLEIRGRGTPDSIKSQITVNGVVGSNLATQNMAVLPMGGGEFVAYAEIGITGFDAHADVAGAGIIEVDSFDWLAIAKAVRGRVTV